MVFIEVSKTDTMEDESMDKVSKLELINKIEDTLSYLLSRKHKADVKIYFKKDGITNGNKRKSSDIRKK